MQVELNYARGHLQVTLPSHVQATVIRKPTMPVIIDVPTALKRALLEPVQALPLPDLARGTKNACIAICDITRPVPNHLFLRPMIEMLQSAGLSLQNISILIATGLHRPNLGAELQELIRDPWVLNNVAIYNHDARCDADHATLGKTCGRGTVVRIDRRFVQADLRIVTGLVEPHFMAGYSGGRKIIAPGLAHAETITTFHNAAFMSDPATTNCNLDHNPLHEEQLEIVSMLGPVWGVNTVIDDQRRLSFINFGEVIASHNETVACTRSCFEVTVPRRFRTVLTSGAGYPLDNNYYQTIKGMVGAIDILEPGGDLIIASACSEGLGSAEFVEAQRQLIASGPSGFLQEIQSRSHARIDEWQTQMLAKAMRAGQIYLYTTGLSPEDRACTGVHFIPSLDQYLADRFRDIASPEIAIIPEGPYVVPRIG